MLALSPGDLKAFRVLIIKCCLIPERWWRIWNWFWHWKSWHLRWELEQTQFLWCWSSLGELPKAGSGSELKEWHQLAHVWDLTPLQLFQKTIYNYCQHCRPAKRSMLFPGEITGKTCISYSSAELEGKGWSGKLLVWSPAPSSCSLASTSARNLAASKGLMVAKSPIDAVLRKGGFMKALSCWGQFFCHSCAFIFCLRTSLYFICTFATLQSSSQDQTGISEEQGWWWEKGKTFGMSIWMYSWAVCSNVSWYMITVGNHPAPTKIIAAKATPFLVPRRYFFMLAGMSLQFFAGGHGTQLRSRGGGCDWVTTRLCL